MPKASQRLKGQEKARPQAKPRATGTASAVKQVTANSSLSTTKKRKVSFRPDDAINLGPDHQLTEYLHHTSSLIREIEEMNKELDTPEIRAVLQKLANRGRVLERIEHRKEVISIGVYMQPKHTQSMLIHEYRAIFEKILSPAFVKPTLTPMTMILPHPNMRSILILKRICLSRP
ncbi:hypothetical protein N7494_011873 [Penicillium frequentans]|uniref:Uncharacterized protein n=1 Tax=Penicillium frequentans TaxID=3151616 RepID=A0AAD6CKH0_9EURO|nr:hypothetical protein N7494_011873 [Penicillium glabrum]